MRTAPPAATAGGRGAIALGLARGSSMNVCQRILAGVTLLLSAAGLLLSLAVSAGV
jgi:hypothetical protein